MDELVKRLRSLKVLLGTDSPEVRGWSSAVQQAAQKTVNDAIAALSAQPQQEPVAWSVFADNGNIRLWTADCSMKKTYEAIHGPMTPLYTAPPSGVREDEDGWMPIENGGFTYLTVNKQDMSLRFRNFCKTPAHATHWMPELPLPTERKV